MEQKEFIQKVVPLREKLMAQALCIVEDSADAEDVVQEVFLKLWYMRKELSQYNSVEALARQITKHIALNRIKAKRIRVAETLTDTLPLTDGVTPQIELERREELRQVMQLIDRLPGLQQSVLRLKHIDGYEVEEIASLTGSTPEAIRMNLSRARKRIKELCRVVVGACAVACLIVGVVWLNREEPFNPYEGSYIVRDGERITDLEEIHPLLEQTLREVAEREAAVLQTIERINREEQEREERLRQLLSETTQRDY